MNIEQLAIEHELMDNIELYGEFKDNEMLLKARREKIKKLEAFAKALQQQSEPVAYLKEWVVNGQNMRRVDFHESCEAWLEHLGVTVSPLFTQPPNTVSLEQYNKLLDALIDCVMSLKGYRNELNDNQPCDAEVKGEKAIAEAERSAK